MTEEQIKEKAKDFVSKIAGGTSKEMDYYANILAEFATEVTKELQEENAELKQKITGLNESFNRLINDIKNCAKPNVRCDIYDLIDDWDIELED